jgi:hypothetical protein
MIKYTNKKPVKKCKVITIINGEHIVVDFDTNNGGEFFRWHSEDGVMETLQLKKFAILPSINGCYLDD